MALSRVSRRCFAEGRYHNLSAMKSFGSCYMNAVTEFDDVDNSLVLSNIGKYYAYLVNSHENMIGDINFGNKNGGGSNYSTNIVVGNYCGRVGESCYMSVYERSDLIEEWSRVHSKYKRNKRRCNTNLIFDISHENPQNCLDLLEMSYDFGVSQVMLSLSLLFSRSLHAPPTCGMSFEERDNAVTSEIVDFMDKLKDLSNQLSSRPRVYTPLASTTTTSQSYNNNNNINNINSSSNKKQGWSGISIILDLSDLIQDTNDTNDIVEIMEHEELTFDLDKTRRYCAIMAAVAKKWKGTQSTGNKCDLMFHVDNISDATIAQYVRLGEMISPYCLFLNFEDYTNQTFAKMFAQTASTNVNNLNTSESPLQTQLEAIEARGLVAEATHKFSSNSVNMSNLSNLTNISINANESGLSGLPLNWHQFLGFGRMSNYFNVFPSLAFCMDTYFTRVVTKYTPGSGDNVSGASGASSQDDFYEFDKVSQALGKLYESQGNNYALVNKIALSNENKFIIHRNLALNIYDNINCRHCDPLFNKTANVQDEITLGRQWEVEAGLAKMARVYEHHTIDNSQCSYNLFKLLENNTSLYKQVKNQMKVDIFGLKSSANGMIPDATYSTFLMDMEQNGLSGMDSNEMDDSENSENGVDLGSIDWDSPVCSQQTAEFVEEYVWSLDRDRSGPDAKGNAKNKGKFEGMQKSAPNVSAVGSMFNVIESDFEYNGGKSRDRDGGFKILATIRRNEEQCDEEDFGQRRKENKKNMY